MRDVGVDDDHVVVDIHEIQYAHTHTHTEPKRKKPTSKNEMKRQH